jgi:hypothetical protein
MTIYVLGAGASRDAGFPLATTMGTDLFRWMKNFAHAPNSYAARYPDTARFMEKEFGPVENIEDLFTAVLKRIEDYENGTQEQRMKRTVIANEYGVLQTALRAWFVEIQGGAAASTSAYRPFARDVVSPGDSIVTFNYDVLLEKELKRAGKFEVGDGYGFMIEDLPGNSATKVLKLHGSTSWLALLFGGRTSGYFQFEPGNTLGSRPVVPKNELSYLGYPDATDPRFAKGGAAIPVMIFPARSKNFYFAANTGTEYAEFWNDLWRQADSALRSASRVVICGYSLLPVDERACKLLLTCPKKNAEITIASGNDTERIVGAFRDAGYTKTMPGDEVLFRNWVSTHTGNIAAAR